MDLSRLRQGEKIAAGSAIALILIMFIFKWFSLSVSSAALGGFGGFSAEVSRNAWGSFGFIDILLFITALAALAMAYVSASGQKVSLPIALSAIVTGLGILCVLLVLFRIISPPNFSGVDLPSGVDKGRKIGAFLGLIATAGLAYGGYVAMQEEGTSFSDTRDQISDRMGGSDGPGGGSGGGTPPSSGGTPPSSGDAPPPSA